MASNRVDKTDMGQNLGTIQNQRGLSALNGHHFSVEERSSHEWLAYLKLFSENVKFFDENSFQSTGTWSSMFPEDEVFSLLLDVVRDSSKTIINENIRDIVSRPDMALMLSFLKIIEHPRSQFQALTEKHKQYYYRQILGLKERQPIPDECHLTLQLNQEIPSLTLEQGIRFDGGNDLSGEPLEYEAVQNSVINQARVTEVATLSHFVSPINVSDVNRESNFLLTQLFNDSKGLELPENLGFTFGESAFYDAERQSYPPFAFQISSPVLWMSEGKRTIKLTFDDLFISKLRQIEFGPDGVHDQGKISTVFDIGISSAEGLIWLTPNDEHCPGTEDSARITEENYQQNIPPKWSIKANYNNAGLEAGVTIVLESIFPSIVAESWMESEKNIPQVKYAAFKLDAPIIVLKLKSGAMALSRYAELTELEFNRLTIQVRVQGLRELQLNNQNDNLDINNINMPFGSEPRVQSKLFFTHPELITKNIIKAKLYFNWLDKPLNIPDYYQTYAQYRSIKIDSSDSTKNTNNEKQLDRSEINGNSYLWPENTVRLLSSHLSHSDETGIKLFDESLDLSGLQFDQFEKLDYISLPFDEQNPQHWPQWFCLELAGNDFGHQEYSQVAEYFSYKNLNLVKDDFVSNRPPSEHASQIIQVPMPYTPTANEISLDYEASCTFDVTQCEIDDQYQLQHWHPMGKQSLSFNHKSGPFSLLPTLRNNGYLYIAIEKLLLPGQVNLYFQIEPVGHSNTTDDVQLTWSYLEDNRWITFTLGKSDPKGIRGAITQDTTHGLLDSGIMTFNIPESATLKSDFLGHGKVWIRATLSDELQTNETPRYSLIKGVYAQGIKVRFMPKAGNVNEHLAKPLPDNSIQQLIEEDSRIDLIEQPFSSFGGKILEDEKQFAIRVSERLRHKNRAQSAWDYEHLILSTFPELYLARCIRVTPSFNQTSQEGSSGFPVKIVVVPKTYDPNILQPKVPLYLKRRMQETMSALAPHNAQIMIVDPQYEAITFEIRLSLHAGFDLGSELKILNSVLIQGLTPWNIRNEEDTKKTPLSKTQGTISIATVVALLEAQSSVDVIWQVRAYGENRQKERFYYKDNIIRPQNEHAILVPSHHHEISLFSSTHELSKGLGVMEMELDFKVASKL